MIDVLLVSPRLPASHPSYSGDNAYTETLLRHPPPGVTYVHYEDSIPAGEVARIKWLLNTNYYLTKAAVLPPDTWLEAIRTTLRPDIIHIVGFSAVVRTPHNESGIPIVIEAPSGSVSDLMVKLQWPEAKVRRAHWIKRLWLRAIKAYDSNLTSERADIVIVQSQHSYDLHTKYGGVDPHKLTVLRPPIPEYPQVRHSDRTDDVVKFLFVGGDFERKNGRLVLEAFRRVHQMAPNTSLTIVGRPANAEAIQEEGVTHYLSLPRETLLREIYPEADVFVLPTAAEGGFAVSVYEAMSFGLPVITVDAWAMREIIEHAYSGYLIPYPPSLAPIIDAMISLAPKDSPVRKQMSQNARNRFQAMFALAPRQERLGEIYTQLIR